MVGSVDDVFAGSIPELYDEMLVPLIFEQYADDLATRTRRLNPERVLEVAAGSGVVTRAVAPVLGPTAEYTVTDLNGPMLEHARSMQPDSERLVWKTADALDLPFEEGVFDLILCQFGAMFFPDRVGAYREAHRVLRDGGAFIFSMWDRLERNAFAFEVTRALAEMFPDDPPEFLARTPHGHFDPAIYRSELQKAGFGDVRVELVEAVSVAESPSRAAVAYCQGTPLQNEIELRGEPGLEAATRAATDAIRRRFGDGPVAGAIRGFVITAQ